MRRLLIPALLFLAACNKPAPTERSFPVCVGKVTVADTPEFIRAIGQLAPSQTITVRAQVSGTVTNSLFVEGNRVEAGDLLITIDQRPFVANLQAAEAQLAQDQAKLSYALDFAETYGTLVGQDYVSRLDYSQGVQNVDVLKATIAADYAAIATAKINLGYTEIRAPIRGYTSLRTYDPGNYVDTSQDTTLVTINSVTPIYVNFSISSEFVQTLRERYYDDIVYIEAALADDPTNPLKGELNFIDNSVNTQTGMIALQAVIPNEDERGWPGQFVRVKLLLRTHKDAILVPLSALVLGQEGYFVFVVDESTMRVTLVPVEKMFEYEGHVVVNGLLKKGETIVTDGQLNLRNGVKVFIPSSDEKNFTPCIKEPAT